jgi:hypothetical protein
MPQNHDHDQQ